MRHHDSALQLLEAGLVLSLMYWRRSSERCWGGGEGGGRGLADWREQKPLPSRVPCHS